MRFLYWVLALVSLSTAALPDTAKPAANKGTTKAPSKGATASAKAPATKAPAATKASTANKTTTPAKGSPSNANNKAPVRTATKGAPPPAKQTTPARSTGATASSHNNSSARSNTSASAAGNNRRPVAASRTTTRPRPVYRPAPAQPTPERYKEIQSALVQRGYLHGEPSGTWDADTLDAMKRFQKDQSLEADGKINSLSLIALGLGPKRTLSANAANPQPPAPTPGSTKPQAPPKP